MQLQIAATTWRLETKSDSAFYQITLVFVGRYDRIPVYIRSRKTGRTLELLGIASDQLSDVLTEAHGFSKAGSWGVRRETKALARLVYGAKQIVDVRTSPLNTQTLPAIEPSSSS